MYVNIATLNKISQVGLSHLKDIYKIVDDVQSAHGILVRSQDMHSMEFSDNLLAIARAGAGVNNIPTDKCAEQGIVVFNTPGANANAVKELVLAGMLLAARHIPAALTWASSLEENVSAAVEKGKSQFAGTEIMGKTLGIVGLGAIGKKVAEAASSLGMEISGYDPFFSGSLENVTIYDDIKEMLAGCDYVTIHVPATDSTKGMFGSDLFDSMKKSAVLLNFSRDKLVNESQLLEALDAGKIAAYVTDFPNDGLVNKDKVILLPHLGASTAEAEDNCATMAVEQLMDYFENGNIRNSVNFPAADLGPKGDKSRVSLFVPASCVDSYLNADEFAGVKVLKSAGGARGDWGYVLLELDTSEGYSLMTYGSNIIKSRIW